MIGSQRSGSNWLRTMLNQREDLVSPSPCRPFTWPKPHLKRTLQTTQAGPHPPHVLRDFMPNLGKFGDLAEPGNLEVLIDHVCTFVERNQVMWKDVHDRPIKFNRIRAANHANDKIEKMSRGLAEGEALKPIFYLLSGPLSPPCLLA